MTLGAIVRDIRHAGRALRRAPTFAITTVLVFGVATCAVGTTWNVFATVVLDAVPGPYASRLVSLSFTSPSDPSVHSQVTQSAVRELRGHTAVFDQVASYQRTHPVTVRVGSQERTLTPLLVSSRFFQVFGVEPLLGRWFADAEIAPGHDRVVMLSERTWRDLFASDASLVGKDITIDGQPYAVVGVMPQSFAVPRPDIAAWMPESIGPAQFQSSKARMDSAIARLRDGVSLDDAHAYVARLVPGVDFETREDLRYQLMPLRDQLVGPVERVLRLFLAAVGLVLLIACVNASILLFVRSAANEREHAIRMALGASGGRVAVAAAMEVCLLAAAGAVAGIGLTAGATAVVRMWGPVDVRRLGELRLDVRAIAAVVGAAGLAALASGLLPVYRTTRSVLDERMKRSTSGDRLHGTFVFAQGVIVVVLAVGAGLLLRSTWKLLTLDVGYDTRNVAGIQFKGSPAATDALLDQARDAVAALPGVETVSSTMLVPGQPGGFGVVFAAQHRSGTWSVRPGFTFYQTVDERYFRAMGIPIVRGRGFLASDVYGAPCVTVIDEALARDAWPDEDPVGLHIDLNVPDRERQDPPVLCEIVGIVRSARFHLEVNSEPFIYFSTHQHPERMRALIVRGRPSGLPLDAALDRIHALDPRLEVIWSGTLNNMLDFQIAQPRFYTFLLSSFAAMSLLLAGIGVYGAAGYAVARRRREIGIRVALGARTADVVGVVVGRLMLAATGGITVGAIASVFASVTLQSILFEVHAHDLATFVAAPATVAAAVLAATLPAARRAASVGPAELLRKE